VGKPIGPNVARRAALPLLVLALGLVAPGRSTAQDPPPVPAPVRVAAAFTAAWNAHDLPAVLARFAPDAIVRERRAEVPAAVWDTRDPQVVRAYHDTAQATAHEDPETFLWVTGHPAIAAWAAGRFAQHHRFAAGPYRAAGDTVRWPYREFVDPFQLAPGVAPAEGEAEAVVRGGRIAVLSLVQSPASVARQRREAAAGIARAAASRRPPGDATEPAGSAWPLALSGLALLGGVAVALRRRRRPLP